MNSLLRRTVLLSLTAFVSVFAIATWLLTRPLPEIPTPPVDEAQDITTDDLMEYQRPVYKRLAEVSIRSVSPEADEVYRLILLPTFDKPVVVRIAKRGDRVQLTKKIFDGVGGYGLDKMGKLAVDESRDIAPEDFTQLRALLTEAEFWELPVRNPDDEAVNDGALWFVDGRDHGVTRSVVRIIPNPRLLGACRFMLRIAELEPDYTGYWSSGS